MTESKSIYVTKYSGEQVLFNSQSLKASLLKSGASNQQTEEVFNEILSLVYDGITTKKLYQLAFKLLKQQRNVFAARYSLKKGLRDLGPAGYYFEKWVGKLFDHYGYQTLTGQIVPGKAVTHEVDVIAQKGDQLHFVECKFRNTVDAKVSVTNPMYFLSRIKDLSDQPYNFFGSEVMLSNGWLVTNAYLTKDAISFANYYGIKVIAWDYPVNNSIKLRVDVGALYPITCLTTITAAEKNILLEKDCILVKDLIQNQSYLNFLDCSTNKQKKILKEAHELIASEQLIQSDNE